MSYTIYVCTFNDLASLRMKTHLQVCKYFHHPFMTQKQNFVCKYFRVGHQNYCALNVNSGCLKQDFMVFCTDI